MFKKIDRTILKKMYNDLFFCENKKITRLAAEKELMRLNLTKETINYYENLSTERENEKYKNRTKRGRDALMETIRLRNYKNLYSAMVQHDFSRYQFETFFLNFYKVQSREEYLKLKFYKQCCVEYFEFYEGKELDWVNFFKKDNVMTSLDVKKKQYEKETNLLLMTKILHTDLVRLLKDFL